MGDRFDRRAGKGAETPLGLPSRRRFLAAGAGVGAALVLPGVPVRAEGAAPMAGMEMGGHAMPPEPGSIVQTPYDAGLALTEPEVRRSVDGVLSTTLRCQYAYKDLGGYRLFMRTYEGTIPGPTLRVKPGDVLRIKLINDLPPNRDPMPADMMRPHHFNSTNMHFHGLHVSPDGISDNVLRTMEPGQTYEVEVAIPGDHPTGTYWYHPHNHGSADIQIASGMFGMIVIEGDFDDVPEIAAATERLVMLSEVVFDGFGTIEDFDTLFPETATRFFAVNGQREPTIAMRPGEVQRWRILHSGYQDDILMALDGHGLHAIARDGIALAGVDRPVIPTTDPASPPDAMLIAPGQRIDVLVRAGDPGTYLLQGLPYDQGYPSPFGPLARVVVAGEPVTMALPAALPPPPLATIRDEEITGSRKLTFSFRGPENDAAGHWQEFRFFIDDNLFDADRVDQRVALGAVEEWTIVNLHRHDHIFHIHVNPFELTKINDEPLAEPVWLDTAVLPRFGSLTFRSRFIDFTGRYMIHCHMMNHEELGMMQVVEVYEP